MLTVSRNRSRTSTAGKILLLQVTLVLVIGLRPGWAQSDAALNANSPQTVDLSQPLTVAWRYGSNLTVNLTPAFDKERVYLPLAGGTIVSLKAADGQLNWISEMGGELSASPAADESGVYVASETGKPEEGARRATGALRALGRGAGVTQWMRTLAMPLRGALTLSAGKLIAGSEDWKVYAFDSKTGELIWTYNYGAPFKGQPVVADGRVYVGSEDGNLLALEESSGKFLWRYKSKGPVRGPVANGRGIIYFGSGDAYLYAVNAEAGKLIWRKRTGAGVESVVRIGDDLLVASLDNFVYKFSLTGARLWKRQLSGRISSQPLIANEGALFTPLASSSGIVLGIRDGRQVNVLPVGEEITTSAASIAVGDTVFLTSEHGLLAFRQPREPVPAKKE
jgi:outer membrane protein assembly factor BamB